MARIRSVKPEFWEDEQIGVLSRDARLLYIATWNVADDEGLLRWAAPYLKANAFMYDDDIGVDEVTKLMLELADAGLVYTYRGGKTQQTLAWIIKFAVHQHPNRPQPSKLSPPSLQNPAYRSVLAERDGWVCHLCHDEIPRTGFVNGYDEDGPTTERHGLSIDHVQPRNAGGSDYPSNLRASHKACNCKKGAKVTEPSSEPDTEQRSEPDTPVVGGGVGDGEGVGVSLALEKSSARKRDPLFDAFAEEVGCTPRTNSERSAWNGALKQLRDADATADEVHRACARYRTQWPQTTLTLPALAKHFSRLVDGKAKPNVSSNTLAIADWASR